MNLFDGIREAVNGFEEGNKDPHLLVIGATGVGKSSLINRIFGEELQEVRTVESTTREFRTHVYKTPKGAKILITDSPGYGEVNHDEQYSHDIVEESRNADAMILVLKADEKGYQRDLDIMGRVARDPEFGIDKAVLIALNQIDKIQPVREWSPPYDLDSPASETDGEKTRNIKEKIAIVDKQFQAAIGGKGISIIPVMCEPSEATDGQPFGIESMKVHLFDVLPEMAKFKYARVAKLAEKASIEVLKKLSREANKVIAASAATAAAAVLANPAPASDWVVLVPLQTAMVIKIGALYGKTLDVASVKETFATLGAGFAARTLFQGIISLLPVAKNFLGPPYAAAATHGIGVAAKAYFKGGRATPEQIEKEIKEELKRRES